MRPKGTSIVVESKVAEAVTRILNSTPKSQFQITTEIGLNRSNILTMIKQGRTKLPIRLVVPLAKACEVDPRELMDIVLQEYQPEILTALGDAYGLAVTSDEHEVISCFRRAKTNKEKKKQAVARRKARTPTEERNAGMIRAEVNTTPEAMRALHDFFTDNLLS